MKDKIIKLSKEIESWIIELRRDFHKHPEKGFEEVRTAKRISEELTKLGIEHTTGVAKTGVVGIIGQGEHCIAVRADIDALGVCDLKTAKYKSTNEGVMHACGHDAHISILLGVARVLKSIESELDGQVKLIFQPAEETLGGALPMLKEGVFENPKVERVLGLHVDSMRKAGTVAVKYGKMYAACSEFEMTVKGVGAHGAHPNEGVDAITITAAIVNSVQTIISRETCPTESGVITFGSIHGGIAPNVVIEEVKLTGTIRALTLEKRAFYQRRLKEMAESIATAYRGEVEVDCEDGYAPAINNEHVTNIVHEVATDLLGEKNVAIKDKPSLGGEDVGYFLQEADGCYFNLGVGNDTYASYAHHNPKFDIVESAMTIGVQVLALSVLANLEDLK